MGGGLALQQSAAWTSAAGTSELEQQKTEPSSPPKRTKWRAGRVRQMLLYRAHACRRCVQAVGMDLASGVQDSILHGGTVGLSCTDGARRRWVAARRRQQLRD